VKYCTGSRMMECGLPMLLVTNKQPSVAGQWLKKRWLQQWMLLGCTGCSRLRSTACINRMYVLYLACGMLL
jgi:hypothetical protein